MHIFEPKQTYTYLWNATLVIGAVQGVVGDSPCNMSNFVTLWLLLRPHGQGFGHAQFHPSRVFLIDVVAAKEWLRPRSDSPGQSIFRPTFTTPGQTPWKRLNWLFMLKKVLFVSISSLLLRDSEQIGRAIRTKPATQFG